MAETAEREREMNLAALRQRDPYITSIKDVATQVAVYNFSSKENEWEKTDIEGTLFVYTRSADPTYGFMIINRLGLHDMIEPINKKLEFQLQDPYLLYKTSKGLIFGIWFYDQDECARLGQLMNSLVQMDGSEARKENDSGPARQRRASESDSISDFPREGNGSSCPATGSKNVDILQMLSKAQDEYDKTKGQSVGKPVVVSAIVANGSSGVSNSLPKAGGPGKIPLNGPPAVAQTGQQVRQPIAVRPKASKAQTASPDTTKERLTNSNVCSSGSQSVSVPVKSVRNSEVAQSSSVPTSSATPISLDVLFKRASLHVDGGDGSDASAAYRAEVVPIKPVVPSQHAASTLEEIERRHIGQSLPGADKLASVFAGASTADSLQGRVLFSSGDPESPNTVLRRTLNIAPPSVPSADPSSKRLLQGQPTVAAFAGSSASPHVSLANIGIPLFHKVSTGAGSESLGFLGRCTSSDHIKSSVGLSHPPADLITPHALMQAILPKKGELDQATPKASSILMSPMEFQTPAAAAAAASKTSSLHTPTNFGQIDLHGVPEHSNPVVVNPLTKEQLQQSLIHLLKNDAEFVCKIHAAYVDSLNQGLVTKGSSGGHH